MLSRDDPSVVDDRTRTHTITIFSEAYNPRPRTMRNILAVDNTIRINKAVRIKDAIIINAYSRALPTVPVV